MAIKSLGGEKAVSKNPRLANHTSVSTKNMAATVPPVNLAGLATSPQPNHNETSISPPNDNSTISHHSPQRRRQIKQLKKQPAIRLHIHILDKSFAMNVGRGTQDLKWLATVAAQRFDRMTKAHGRVRQRETMRALRNVRVVLPAEVRTPRGSPPTGC